MESHSMLFILIFQRVLIKSNDILGGKLHSLGSHKLIYSRLVDR